MNVLLIEPMYHRVNVPLSLMKFSSYHKAKGDNVKYVRSNNVGLLKDFEADKVYITSLFTWDVDKVIKATLSAKATFPKADISVGGICATLMADKIEKETGVKVHKGLVMDVENVRPDYSIFPEIDYSLSFTTRGCVRSCPWCMVSRNEPKYFEIQNWENQLDLTKSRIILMDNNFLACTDEHFKNVTEQLQKYNKPVDFNQALDARLLTRERAQELAKIRFDPLRFAFDTSGVEKQVRQAVGWMKEFGFPTNKITIFVLYNFHDTIEDATRRCKIIQDELGAVPYAMRFKPLDSLDNSDYLGEHWTEKDIDKFRSYWNRTTISKSCTYEDYEPHKAKEHRPVRLSKGQKDLGIF